MGDAIDTAMQTAWPQITKAVETAMAAVGKVDTFFPTEALTEAVPYRGRVVAWNAVPGHPDVRVADVAVTGCYEIRQRVALSAEEVRTFAPEVIAKVAEAARAARAREIRTIAAMVCEGAATAGYTAEVVGELRRTLVGPLRLISPKDEVATEVEANGDVDEIVKPTQGVLPNDVHHVLVPLAEPVVRRLVDGLTPTWTRGTADQPAIVTISERFFLDHIERCCVLI